MLTLGRYDINKVWILETLLERTSLCPLCIFYHRPLNGVIGYGKSVAVYMTIVLLSTLLFFILIQLDLQNTCFQSKLNVLNSALTQATFTRFKSTIETPKQFEICSKLIIKASEDAILASFLLTLKRLFWCFHD